MVIRTYPGMELMGRIRWAIVPTTLSCSLPGIDLIWRCMKYDGELTALIRPGANVVEANPVGGRAADRI